MIAKALATVLLATTAFAGHPCVQRVVVHDAQPVVHEVVQYQQFQQPQYYAGLGVREDAVAELVAEKLRSQLQAETITRETRTVLRPVEQQQQQQQYHQPPPQPQQQPHCDGSCSQEQATFNFSAPIVPQACTKCHSGDQEKGGFNFSTATPEQLNQAAEAVYDGSMPPRSNLTQQEQDQIAFQVWKVQRMKSR